MRMGRYSVGGGGFVGQGGRGRWALTAEAEVLPSGEEVRGSPAHSQTHQCLPGEDLQQGDEVVSISEVLVQVCDVPLRLRMDVERGWLSSSNRINHFHLYCCYSTHRS